nr:uncharacterized protein LOC108128379 [Drosophila bipectinata]
MIFPVVLISAFFLISTSVGSEESCYLSEEQEDQCASVCYPIVKPLLRYFEKSKEKDVQLLQCKTDYSELQKRYSELGLEKYDQISKCQKDYSDLERRHSEVQDKYTDVLSKLNDIEVKYERLLAKQQESENLNALINQKNKEIELLKEQNRDLKKTNELATLTNQFRENIDRLGEIVKNGANILTESTNKTKVNTGGVPTTPLPSISDPTTPKTEIIDLPDPCPRNQTEYEVLREIQLPGSDPNIESHV